MVPLILRDLEGSGGYCSSFCRLAGGVVDGSGSSSHCMQSDSSVGGPSVGGAPFLGRSALGATADGDGAVGSVLHRRRGAPCQSGPWVDCRISPRTNMIDVCAGGVVFPQGWGGGGSERRVVDRIHDGTCLCGIGMKVVVERGRASLLLAHLRSKRRASTSEDVTLICRHAGDTRVKEDTKGASLREAMKGA